MLDNQHIVGLVAYILTRGESLCMHIFEKENRYMAKKKSPKKVVISVIAAVLGVAIISAGTVFAYKNIKPNSDNSKPTKSEKKEKEKEDDSSYALTMGDTGHKGNGKVEKTDDNLDFTNSSVNDIPDSASSWTVLVYMCGSNLESGNGFGSIVMDRMDDMISSDNVNVIVETGGTSQWLNKDPYFNGDAVKDVDISADELGRFQIKNNEVIDLGSVPLDSMGKASTLSDFIKFGKENYPAQKYALVLWNHGYVEPYGNLEADDIFFTDENGKVLHASDLDPEDSMPNDCLTLDELNEALSDGGVHFEAMIFNTCLSSSIEIAKTVAPYASYMVASEESIPAMIGIPEQYIDFLNTNPECTGKELGNYICQEYGNALETVITTTDIDSKADGMFSKSTMACIDLSSMNEMWECYTEVMKHVYYSTYDMTAYTGFLNAASNCENYGSEGNVEGNLIDLKSFLVNAAPYLTETDADERLISLIDSKISVNNGPARINSNGISCYFPSYNYVFNLKARVEGALIAGGYVYTEDQLDMIVGAMIKDSMDGYVDNIDNNEEYFWSVGYLDYRLGEYWSPVNSVADLIENYVDDDHTNVEVINTEEFNLSYKTWVDDDDKYRLAITDGSDGVMSVKMNLVLCVDADDPSTAGYDTMYTYFGSTDSGVVFDDATNEYYNNYECEWYFLGNFPVPVYTIESTDAQTIYGFRAKVNDEDAVVVFSHDKKADKCKILYACRFEETNGLASNDIFYLTDGDVIDVYFFTYTYGTGLFSDYLLIRPFFKIDYTTDTEVRIERTFGSTANVSYVMNYTITDAFGNTYYTDFVKYDIVNGSIVNIEKADVPSQVCDDLYGVV